VIEQRLTTLSVCYFSLEAVASRLRGASRVSVWTTISEVASSRRMRCRRPGGLALVPSCTRVS